MAADLNSVRRGLSHACSEWAIDHVPIGLNVFSPTPRNAYKWNTKTTKKMYLFMRYNFGSDIESIKNYVNSIFELMSIWSHRNQSNQSAVEPTDQLLCQPSRCQINRLILQSRVLSESIALIWRSILLIRQSSSWANSGSIESKIFLVDRP